MAKKQNKVESQMQAFNAQVISMSLQNLDSYTEEQLNDTNYIPSTIRPRINDFVREQRKTFDFLSNGIERLDKSSDEYIAYQSEMEHIGNSFINLRSQIDKFKNSKMQFKQALSKMNKGTSDSNYFLNSAVFGEVGTTPEIDTFGNLSFAMATPSQEGEPEINKFKLNDMENVLAGSSPIITEPFGTKKFVWDLANKTKLDKDNGVSLDEDFIKRSTLNNLTEFGPNNTIGMAFTDMSGDQGNKSFAEQYDEGFKDRKYYTHPETGEQMPTDSAWMKDPANVKVLNSFLTEYITDIMNDIYGTIDSETGQISKPNQSQLAQNLIKKYKK